MLGFVIDEKVTNDSLLGPPLRGVPGRGEVNYPPVPSTGWLGLFCCKRKKTKAPVLYTLNLQSRHGGICMAGSKTAMMMLDKFGNFNRTVSAWIEWIGLIGLLLVMVITCVDVVGSKLFRSPLFGALDIVMLAQLVAISFAAAYALILGKHVSVEFFVTLLPKGLQAFVACIISFLGFTLFALIAWRLCVYGYDLQTWEEVSATALIPLYPFAYGIAFASIPVCLVFTHDFITAMLEMVRR